MDFLQNFLKENHIQTVVDAGCGDWEFSKHINWDGINYIGYDVVAYIIEKNQKNFSAPNKQFFHGSLLTTDLPAADLLLCKDVLQHLTNDDILKFLPQLKKYKFCLITNQINPKTHSSKNPNIPVGGARPVDLTQKPFNIPGFKVLTYSAVWDTKQVLLIVNDSLVQENSAPRNQQRSDRRLSRKKTRG